MREFCEFRVDEKFASRLFAPDEGKRLGETIRKVELATDDPRFEKVGELQREILATTDIAFFYGWMLRYRYSKAELAAASCFQLRATTAFEPAGEECGTEYDESTACSKCGAGAKQVSDLFIAWKRIPRNKDISRTIAGELIVSLRLVELFRRRRITGVEFEPVRRRTSSSAESNTWFQLRVQSAVAEIIPPTRVGIDPFDDDAKGECRCPRGDLIGLDQLSELSVKAATRGDADVVCTRQFMGVRRGLLRPERRIIISPKVWRLIESEKLKGFKFQVVHLI